MQKTNNTKYNFLPFDEILGKELKNKQFRKVFSEETSALQLAHEIKALRQKIKLTQRETAIRAKMPQSVIARLESGAHSCSITTLQRVAVALGVKIRLVPSQSHR